MISFKKFITYINAVISSKWDDETEILNASSLRLYGIFFAKRIQHINSPGMRRLNTSTRCILRPCNTLRSIYGAKIESLPAARRG
jgi:hypothetical protein